MATSSADRQHQTIGRGASSRRLTSTKPLVSVCLGCIMAFVCTCVHFAAHQTSFSHLSRPKHGRRYDVARSAATSTDVVAKPKKTDVMRKFTEEDPLNVVVVGAGVGGLALANAMKGEKHIKVRVVEQCPAFERFGGPIQLASNAMALLRDLDSKVYEQIEAKATWTGNLSNGIKDGIRDEWYAMFDLKEPAKERGMPYTCVVERPDLHEIMLGSLKDDVVSVESKLSSFTHEDDGTVTAHLENGNTVHADVLIGADGIWSATRAQIHNNPMRGEGSGASYSGYTVYAGELNYKSPDNGKVGYKVFIGPNQYFVVTDIGKGRYQWYAFLAKPVGSKEAEEALKPQKEIDGCAAGNPAYLRQVFEGWSKDIHDIVRATRDDEIAQRDLYDRPPSLIEPWTEGNVALLGDAIHAMMPNLGQGGCQALEDSMVIAEELKTVRTRAEIKHALECYKNRRLIRSAAVQGLSRFASDIIIRGFDTPAKITTDNNGIQFENFGYAGIVTRMLQPILPTFFNLQFNFLYSGWRNKTLIDGWAGLGLLLFGGGLLVAYGFIAGDLALLGALGLDGLVTGAREGGTVLEALRGVEGAERLL